MPYPSCSTNVGLCSRSNRSCTPLRPHPPPAWLLTAPRSLGPLQVSDGLRCHESVRRLVVGGRMPSDHTYMRHTPSLRWASIDPHSCCDCGDSSVMLGRAVEQESGATKREGAPHLPVSGAQASAAATAGRHQKRQAASGRGRGGRTGCRRVGRPGIPGPGGRAPSGPPAAPAASHARMNLR